MEKGSACIGFIKKKFVTMQGHMNMIHTSIYIYICLIPPSAYEGWNFNSGNYLFTTDTK